MSRIDFRLPDVGEGLMEATIVSWMVDEGASVERFEPLVEIETAKSVAEIPSPVSGVLVRHGAAAGSVLAVGDTLAVLEVSEGSGPVGGLPARGVRPAPPARARTPEDAGAGPGHVGHRVPASPKARSRAAALGIDISLLEGTGPGGQVTTVDVDEAASRRDDRHADRRADRTEPLSPMRAAIAERLSAAWQSVPLITELREVDASAVVDAHAALRSSDEEGRVTYTAIFCWIAVRALEHHPSLNASLDVAARTITRHGAINLGVAVSVPGGLSVGVVRDADLHGLRSLALGIADVTRAAREGSLQPARASGATFTVTSFGQFGGWFGTPLVVPPQVAIAGFGAIRDRVLAVDGEPAVRPTLPMSVSVDHRVVDGAELSSFCSRVEALVADPLGGLG